MKTKKIISLFVTAMISVTCIAGCSSSADTNKKESADSSKSKYKTFTAFFSVPGKELPKNNRMKEKIAEVTGVKVDETWLTGVSAEERIGVMIAGREYPDFLQGNQTLVDAGALVQLDDYVKSDKYPNLKNYFTEKEWKKCCSPDGHLYMIPQFAKIQGRETSPTESGEAFWIQKKVLEWANFPTIKTLDEYFDLIEKYKEANPTIDGQPTIGFEILSANGRDFALENPPQFLAGYPNDGKAIVDKDTLTAHIYDTIPEAKAYYKKLSEEYKKGIVDPETFTNNYDQYIAKLSQGTVLGMIDQGWEFGDARTALVQQGKDELTWVPLPLVLDESVTPHYKSKPALNGPAGMGISTSCKDLEGALKFINDLLSPEVITMRSWGEKDVDYEVDENGVFYRTDEQRKNAKDQEWVNQNMCPYSYFPTIGGMMEDGINTINPGDQPGEFYASLCDTDKKILDAYGYKTFTEFMNQPTEENGAWFPIYTFTETLDSQSAAGIAYKKIFDIKKQYLPQLIMTDPSDFDAAWDDYTTTLTTQADVKAYEDAHTEEVRRRVKEFGE